MPNARTVVLVLRPVFVLLALFALVARAPRTAHAQAAPAPSAAALAEASKHTAVADKLFRAQLYEAALPEYKQAYALAARANDLLHVAQAYEKLGEAALAYDAYATLARVHGPRYANKKTLDDLDAKTGLVQITAQPDGVRLVVGDRELGTSPLAAPVRLDAGVRRVRATKDGFDAWAGDVTVTPHQTARLDIALDVTATTGHVVVREQSGAAVDVWIDDADRGPAPWEGDVAPGSHSVELRGGGLASQKQSVDVVRGKKLELLLAASPTGGKVRIEVTPPSATIRINGDVAGSGALSRSLDAGEYTIEVSNAGYETETRKLRVEIGGDALVKFELTAAVVEKTPEEIARERAEATRRAYVGFYGDVAVFAAYAPSSYPQVSCASEPPYSSCSSGVPLAGGAVARVGYSFGWVGLELVGAFLTDHRTDSVSISPPSTATTTPEGVGHSESLTFASFGGLVGVGPRISTHGRARVSLGVAGGVAYRYFTLSHAYTDGLTGEADFSSSYAAPGVIGDLTLTLGESPGVKFLLGVVAWADFPGSTITSPQGAASLTSSSGSTLQIPVQSYPMVTGTQFYFGPIIGMRFGH